MEAEESRWIRREPSLASNSSALYNSEIGAIFVELVDEEVLSAAAARTLGTFLVAFCPQVTELDGYAPPKDVPLPEMFYAVLSPASLRRLLAVYGKINRHQLRNAVASYLDAQPSAEVASADEFLGYLQGWRDAMYEAMQREHGLLIFCG